MKNQVGVHENIWWLDSLETISIEHKVHIPSGMWDVILLLFVPCLIQRYILHRWRRTVQGVLFGPYLTRPLSRVVALSSTFLAIEFRFLLPYALYIAHAIHGQVVVQPLWLTTMYLSTSLLLTGSAVWFYGRKKYGEYLGGEYHDDIFQVLLIASTVTAAMACALPWRVFPFVIVAILSLSLFISTRMVSRCYYSFLESHVLDSTVSSSQSRIYFMYSLHNTSFYRHDLCSFSSLL